MNARWSKRKRAKGIIFGLLFAPGFGLPALTGEGREKKRRQRDMELAELNTTHKLSEGTLAERDERPAGI